MKICFGLIVIICTVVLTFAQAPILSGPSSGNVQHIIVLPNISNTVVVANSNTFTGFLKSNNDGRTWNLLNIGIKLAIPPEYSSVRAFTFDPQSPDTFYSIIRTYNSQYLYRSFNMGNDWEELLTGDLGVKAVAAVNNNLYVYFNNELLYSSDGGDSFDIKNTSIPLTVSLLIDPTNNQNIYAATLDSGLYLSTNAGSSFSCIGFTGNEIIDFDLYVNDTLRILAAASGGSNLHLSYDDGESWILRNQGLPDVTDVLFCIEDPDIIYVSTWTGIYKSIDQGMSWFTINNGLLIETIFFPEPDPPMVSLAVDPNDSNILYAGSDYAGLFKSNDAGGMWQLIGIPSGEITGLSVSPHNPDLIFCGVTNGFFAKHNNGWNSTTLWGFPQGVKSVGLNPIDTNIVIATYGNSFDQPLVFKSNDGGNTWDLKEVLFEGDLILDYVFDPVNPNKIYGIWWAGYGMNRSGFLISEDNGDTWEITYYDSINIGPIIRPFAINPDNEDDFYLVEEQGRIYRSIDKGITWYRVKEANDTSHYAIIIDPANTNHIYAASYGMWQSLDNGESWDRIGPNVWYQDLAFDENTGYLYASTFGNGIYYTTNGGVTWDSLPKPQNPYIRNIEVGSRDGYSILYGGTYGTGVFKWDLNTNPIKIENEGRLSFKEVILHQNYPNPFNDFTRINLVIYNTTHVSLEIFNLLGQSVKILAENKVYNPGFYDFTWNGKGANGEIVGSGIYFIKLTSNNYTDMKKLIFLK